MRDGANSCYSRSGLVMEVPPFHDTLRNARSNALRTTAVPQTTWRRWKLRRCARTTSPCRSSRFTGLRPYRPWERASFIEPCLPSPADRPPSGANWVTITPNGVDRYCGQIQHRRTGHDLTAQRASASNDRLKPSPSRLRGVSDLGCTRSLCSSEH
jgi:hypothetical protein